jgi:hypothetical protein
VATPNNDGQEICIAPTTSAKVSNPFTSKTYQWFAVSADHLTGVEEVNIQIRSGAVLVQVLMPDLVTPAKLTATLLGLALLGGPTYVFTKSTTGSACGVYIDPILQ